MLIYGALLLLGVCLAGFSAPLCAQEAATDAEVRLLLSRLDLSRPELHAVKAAQHDPAQAAEALQAYYRARTTVRHPVDPATRHAALGQYASAEQMKRARDAVKNTVYSLRANPPQAFDTEIDWFTNRSETKDNEWLWQLHRQYWWSDLAKACWHTGEAQYAEAWVRQMRHWVRRCPRDPNSPAWRTIEAGIRGHAWTHHYQHFLHAPAFTPRDLVLFLNACWEHAAFLADGREFHDNNWGLMEAEGVAFIAVTFPEFTRSQAWQTQAMAFLAAQIHLQVRPDGHHKEQCLSYHGGCINWFANTAKLAKLNGKEDAFPPAFWQRLEQMCAVFVKLGLPDGTTTQFGDDHSGNNWMNTLKAWSEVFHRDDFRFLATAGAAGMAPKETAFALKESGFYAFRSGWNRDAVCLVLKNGPDGGWHCQPDNGTFELYAAGRRLMPDSGAYIYTGDAAAVALRTWFRHRHGDDYSSIMSSQ